MEKNQDPCLTQISRVGAPQLESHVGGGRRERETRSQVSCLLRFAVFLPSVVLGRLLPWHTALSPHTCGHKRLRSFSACGLMLNLNQIELIGSVMNVKEKVKRLQPLVRRLRRESSLTNCKNSKKPSLQASPETALFSPITLYRHSWHQ